MARCMHGRACWWLDGATDLHVRVQRMCLCTHLPTEEAQGANRVLSWRGLLLLLLLLLLVDDVVAMVGASTMANAGHKMFTLFAGR